jgi:hypothetical protein
LGENPRARDRTSRAIQGAELILPRSQTIGLCARCRHARIVTTPRSQFWLCARAASDPRFVRYPRLPVLECPGHEDGDPVSMGQTPEDQSG